MAGLLEVIRTTQKPRVNAYTAELLSRAEAEHGEGSGPHLGILNQYFRMPTTAPGTARSTRHYDALGDLPVGVERLYRRVVVVDMLYACASECVFCIRGLYDRHTLNGEDMSAIVDYLARDPLLTEVLITGGDPLIAPKKLREFVSRIGSSAPNIRVIRIGTRLPVQDPHAFSDVTYDIFAQNSDRFRFEVALQVNHPFELQPEAVDVLERLASCSVRLYSQNVLLRGVNDRIETLIELYDRLRELDVIPHYLFHAVPIVGTDEFRTSVSKGLRLSRELTASGYVSGRAKPVFTLMTDVGKVTLYEGSIRSTDDGVLTIRTAYRLSDRVGWNPGYRLPETARVNDLGTIDVEYVDGADSSPARRAPRHAQAHGRSDRSANQREIRSPRQDSVDRLRSAVRGQVLQPADSGYEEARKIWNGLFDRRPALIVKCRDAADVSVVVRYGLDEGFPLTVRGGGHNVAGRSIADDAILIDLGSMREVTVDTVARTAIAGGGCLLRDLDAATTSRGLACPSGVVSHTGLGGLALGGGYGWLARKWGLTCDHIVAAEVVLADGSIVEATERSEPDLLRALRGGGGSCGIVTRFVLKLRPVDRVHFRRFVFGLDDAVEALKAYASFAETQPSDLHVVGSLSWAPDEEWIPKALRGERALFLKALWLGAPELAMAATEPLTSMCAPASSKEATLPFFSVQALGDASEPAGRRYYTKSCYLDAISHETAVDTLESILDCPSRRSAIDFGYLMGAIAETPVPTVFPHRSAPYMFTASSQWLSPAEDEPNISWARSTIERWDPHGRGGVYVNYADPGATLDAMMGRSDEYQQFEKLKNRYDPENVFDVHRDGRDLANGGKL